MKFKPITITQKLCQRGVGLLQSPKMYRQPKEYDHFIVYNHKTKYRVTKTEALSFSKLSKVERAKLAKSIHLNVISCHWYNGFLWGIICSSVFYLVLTILGY